MHRAVVRITFGNSLIGSRCLRNRGGEGGGGGENPDSVLKSTSWEKKKDFRDHRRPNTVDQTGSRGHFILLGLSSLRLAQGRWKPDVLQGRG